MKRRSLTPCLLMALLTAGCPRKDTANVVSVSPKGEIKEAEARAGIRIAFDRPVVNVRKYYLFLLVAPILSVLTAFHSISFTIRAFVVASIDVILTETLVDENLRLADIQFVALVELEPVHLVINEDYNNIDEVHVGHA